MYELALDHYLKLFKQLYQQNSPCYLRHLDRQIKIYDWWLEKYNTRDQDNAEISYLYQVAINHHQRAMSSKSTSPELAQAHLYLVKTIIPYLR